MRSIRMQPMPTTPVLRREQVNLQAPLRAPVLHVKGYAAPAAERARLY